MQAAEIRRAATRPTTGLTSYDLYLRALSELTSCDREHLRGGLALLDQALVRDPNYAPVLALAAVYRVELENHSWTDDPQTNRAEAIELARRALRSGVDDPSILDRVAVTLGRFGDDLDAAIALVDRALVLNPSSADGWYRSGWLRLFAGLPDLALEHFAASLRLDPRTGRGFHLAGIGTAHFLKQEFEQAAARLRASLEELPSFTPTHRILASCYAHMGRVDEARALVAQLRTLTARILPDIQLFRDARHCELFLSGLRLAAD